jgi:hypothetical protein
MGVLVSGPGPFDPALLPPMPPAPRVTNLDVTTLCALVSEVSHADPKGPELQAWAQRVTHWRVGTYITSCIQWGWIGTAPLTALHNASNQIVKASSSFIYCLRSKS